MTGRRSHDTHSRPPKRRPPCCCTAVSARTPPLTRTVKNYFVAGCSVYSFPHPPKCPVVTGLWAVASAAHLFSRLQWRGAPARRPSAPWLCVRSAPVLRARGAAAGRLTQNGSNFSRRSADSGILFHRRGPHLTRRVSCGLSPLPAARRCRPADSGTLFHRRGPHLTRRVSCGLSPLPAARRCRPSRRLKC